MSQYRWTSFVLGGAVIALAVALVWLGISTYRNTVRTAESGLRARVIDRAFAVRRALDSTDEPAADVLSELVSWESGYAHIVTFAGELVATTETATNAPGNINTPKRRAMPPGQPLVRRSGSDLEVWLHIFTQRRGEDGANPDRRPRRKERRRWKRGRRPTHFLVVGLPLSAARDGLERAVVHLAVSIISAVVLLILAFLGIRSSRRAARLAVEMERRQRLSALGQLAAILAHEIRTPLSAVRGWAQVLAERLEPGDERTRKPADRIVRETDRLGRLVDDLLGYAQPAAPSFSTIDLGELATECAERLAAVAAANNVTVQVRADKVATDYPGISADADRLGQVLDNLARNAIEASPEGSTVDIVTAVSRNEATVSVLDRGPGVPDDRKSAIFEPFNTDRASGTGLGLAVARRIADEHDGTLTVTDRPGGGSEFTLRIPRRARG